MSLVRPFRFLVASDPACRRAGRLLPWVPCGGALRGGPIAGAVIPFDGGPRREVRRLPCDEVGRPWAPPMGASIGIFQNVIAFIWPFTDVNGACINVISYVLIRLLQHAFSAHKQKRPARSMPGASIRSGKQAPEP